MTGGVDEGRPSAAERLRLGGLQGHPHPRPWTAGTGGGDATASSQMRVTVAARTGRLEATVSVHPALRHSVTREVRGQAERATPPLQDIALDRGCRLGAHLEYRQDLPAVPAVLRQA
jgi:hypothetical protein